MISYPLKFEIKERIIYDKKNLNMNYFNNEMLLLVIHAGMKVATLKKKYISVTHVSGYVNFYCNDCHLHIRM